MPYSILEGERPQARPHHLYHVFSRAEWERYPFAAPEDVRWFREAKLGLFLHVGLSAMGGVDLSWPRHTHKPPDGGAGPVLDEVYDHWAEELALPAFDARAWVRMAREAGMRYIVIVAKHHDGFHMWDTAFSDYKITNAPFGRDYLRELVDACHEAGMRVGIYYSQRDWKHPDYEPVPPELAARANGQRFCWPQGEELRVTPRHQRYIEYLRATVHELMTRYGRIDILWWDAAWWGGMFLAGMWDAENVEKEARAAQPHLLINDRASLPGDFDTPEGSVGFFQSHRPWETCMPLGKAWAWTGEDVKSFSEILRQCVQCVCGDGNYLLSVGCMPNGDLTPRRNSACANWARGWGAMARPSTARAAAPGSRARGAEAPIGGTPPTCICWAPPLESSSPCHPSPRASSAPNASAAKRSRSSRATAASPSASPRGRRWGRTSSSASNWIGRRPCRRPRPRGTPLPPPRPCTAPVSSSAPSICPLSFLSRKIACSPAWRSIFPRTRASASRWNWPTAAGKRCARRHARTRSCPCCARKRALSSRAGHAGRCAFPARPAELP